jgi:hypothetical protein
MSLQLHVKIVVIDLRIRLTAEKNIRIQPALVKTDQFVGGFKQFDRLLVGVLGFVEAHLE